MMEKIKEFYHKHPAWFWTITIGLLILFYLWFTSGSSSSSSSNRSSNLAAKLAAGVQNTQANDALQAALAQTAAQEKAAIATGRQQEQASNAANRFAFLTSKNQNLDQLLATKNTNHTAVTLANIQSQLEQALQPGQEYQSYLGELGVIYGEYASASIQQPQVGFLTIPSPTEAAAGIGAATQGWDNFTQQFIQTTTGTGGTTTTVQ